MSTRKPRANDGHVSYLKAFGIDASDWTSERAYRFYNYFRPGDEGSADPQPKTNHFAQTYLSLCQKWMDEYVEVPGSKNPGNPKGIRGLVVAILPRPKPAPLRGSPIDTDIHNPHNWQVTIQNDNGSKTKPISLATVVKVNRTA